jgi:hypothetical protein
MNIRIRQHVQDEHGYHLFEYRCRRCSKAYTNINAVKAHHTACKRQPVPPPPLPPPPPTNVTIQVATNTSHRDTTAITAATAAPSDPLQCPECHSLNIVKSFKDKRALTTHRRLKHPAEYEASKTVASIRVGWSTDEDSVLAQLELKLKSTQKGQILNRLHAGYNEIAASSNAPPRSKEAIRGRRQQAEYKALMDELKNNDGYDSDDSASSNNSTAPGAASSANNCTNDNNNNGTTEVRKLLGHICTNMSGQLQNDTVKSIKGYMDNLPIDHILELSIRGIIEAVEAHRAKHPSIAKKPKTDGNSTKKPIRNEKRRQSAQTHGHYQRLFYKNPKKLVAELIDGESTNTMPPPIKVAEDFYKKIWSKPVKDQAPFTIKAPCNSTILFAPITIHEIEQAINNTKKDSAAGPDRVNWFETKGIINELYAAYNLWLTTQRIPNQIKENRTTLIPKANSDSTQIKNWRPITISSMILRTYNKILGYRINQVFKTSDKQVGFKPVNGCGINITWLHTLLKHARLNKNNIYACLIDVSKAFDSVSHESIIRSLKRNGAPQMLVDLIVDQYTNASTKITYEDVSSQKIEILCGVKQGDPLSSILFNLVMDELFDVLKDDHGYSIQGVGQTNARCFADDLCLVSSSRIGMGELIKKTTTFLEARGLAVNPGKCITIGLAKGYKGKKCKIETESLFSINGTPVPMLGYTDNKCRYLGVNFTSHGAIDSRQLKTQIGETLTKTCKIKLKAQCKINLLRTYIIPRFIHQLVNTELHPCLLRRIDISIRKAVRSILHLPSSLSNEFFYLPFKEGGLQFPELHQAVGIAKVKLFKRIAHMGDPILQYLVDAQYGNLNEKFLNNLQLGNSFVASDINKIKDQNMRDKRTSFAQKIHSIGHEIFSTCPLTNQWIRGDTRTMSTRTYINSIKLRTNTFETKVTTTRGLNTDKRCRKCGLGDESLMHVLQICPETKGLRYARHHKICRRVSQKLLDQGYQVYNEKSFPNPNQIGCTLRPDIVATKNDNLLILDVSAIYERTGATFINTYRTKVDKYMPILAEAKQQLSCSNGVVHGLIIGSRGSFYHSQLHIWHQLGISTTDLKYIAVGCQEDSIKIVSSLCR